MTTMHKRRSRARLVMAVIGVVAVALIVAGCGGASSGGYGGSSSSATKSSTANGSVALATTKLGKILVNGEGRTLYLFDADKGTSSMCDGACASAWPPLTTSGEADRWSRRFRREARHHEAQPTGPRESRTTGTRSTRTAATRRRVRRAGREARTSVRSGTCCPPPAAL